MNVSGAYAEAMVKTGLSACLRAKIGTVTRFAWLPIRTLNGDRRWLQRVHIRQIYLTSMRKFGFGSVWKSRWLNGDFVLSAEFEEIADRTN